MNTLRTLWLWAVTAVRAAPLMSAVMCVTTIVSAVLSPLSLYGVKLAIDAVTGHTSIWPGILLLGGALLLSTMAATIAGPMGDTVDEKVARYVHSDLIRLTSEIPSVGHHEHPELADRLALVERDAWELGGIYRLLSTIGAVSGTITVVSMLWSIQWGLTLLLVVALAPAVIYSIGLHKRNLLWKSNERYRRLGHKVVETMLEPRQGVEVRCFGLSLPLLRVAGRIAGRPIGTVGRDDPAVTPGSPESAGSASASPTPRRFSGSSTEPGMARTRSATCPWSC